MNRRLPPRILILPPQWEEIASSLCVNTRAYIQRDGLKVVVGEEKHAGAWWQHVSVSRPNMLPSWADLRHVKALFIGRENKAIQVLPAEREYVDFHPYCLHLFRCLARDPLPDFTEGLAML